MELLDQIKKEVEAGSVSEYSEFNATLAEYQSEVPDASTKDGYARAKEVAGVLTKTRTAIETKRKDYKAPVLALGKLIDGEAKRITELVKAVEDPFKEAYRAVDDEKKRRKAELESKIQGIKDLSVIALEKTSEEVEAMIVELADMDVSKEIFGRRTDEAAELVAFTLGRLSEIQGKHIETELEAVRVENERIELDKLRQEAAARESAEQAAAEQAAREAEEARIAEQAAEQARIESERQAQAAIDLAEREKQEAIEREQAAEQARLDAEAKAQRDAEAAEQARIEAQAKAQREAEAAEQARIQAAEQAKRDAEAAAERARIEEQQRQQAEAERIQREQEQREANNRHVGNIRRQTKDDLMKLGLDEATAKKVVLAIHNKEVRNVGISY